MKKELLVEAKGVAKKFSKDFRKSLHYGIQDITRDMTGRAALPTLRSSEFWAVKDFDLEVRRGETVAIIGHNGAGKSTVLKMLNGLIKPDKGIIHMRGQVGAMIELKAGFNPLLSGRENVYINGTILGFSHKEIDAVYNDIVNFAELHDFMHVPIQNYSSGMRIRLGFSIAIQMRPDILIIDEVLAVGDIGFRGKCIEAISKVSNRTATIIVSHNMLHVVHLASRVIILDHGSIMLDTENINQALDAYYELYPVREREQIKKGVELQDIYAGPDVSPAGESNVDVLQDSNRRYIEIGQDLLVRFSVKKKPGLEGLRCIVVFRKYGSIPVAYSEGVVSGLNGKTDAQLEIRFPRFGLTPGKYTISIRMREPDDPNYKRFLCIYNNVAIFNVVGEFEQNAQVILQGNFTELNP